MNVPQTQTPVTQTATAKIMTALTLVSAGKDMKEMGKLATVIYDVKFFLQVDRLCLVEFVVTKEDLYQ